MCLWPFVHQTEMNEPSEWMSLAIDHRKNDFFPKMNKLSHFIDGKFVMEEQEFFESLNPSTLEKVEVPLGNAKEIDLAAQAASKAFKTWSKTSRQYRSSMLLKIADLIESRLEEFAQAESQDQGKPVSLARRVDIPR